MRIRLDPTRRAASGLCRGVVEALVHSNVFIAVAATSVAVTTTVLAEFPLRAEPLFVVFAATLFVYSMDRVLDRSVDERNLPSRATFLRSYGQYCLAAGVGLYVVATLLAVSRHGRLGAVMLLPPVVGLLYSTVGCKRILLVKNLLVGLSWGVIPLGVGVYFGDLWRPAVGFLFLWVSCLLTIAAVIFDIKDIDGDRAAGIRTFPVVYGPDATRRGAQVANGFVAATVLAALLVDVVPTRFAILLVFQCYVAAYVQAATVDRGPLFYGFIVDGEHVLLAALALAVT